MSRLMELKKKRDEKIHEKNSLLKTKWDIEDDISKWNKDNLFSRHRNDNNIVSSSYLTRAKNKIYLLNTQIRAIDKELSELSKLIEQGTIIELNSKYISDNNLSDLDIKELINRSNELSEKFNSTINDYTIFLNELDSSLKEFKDDSYYNYLNQSKIKIETQKKYLLNYKEQCIEFEQYEVLKYNLNHANANLLIAKTEFRKSKLINKKFNSVVNSFISFLSNFDADLKNLNEEFIYPDLNQIRIQLQNKISELSEYKNKCLESNGLEDLNESIISYKNDLAKIRNDYTNSFNKSKILSNKFDDFIKYYMSFLSSFDSELKEIEDDFWYDDYGQFRFEIKTKVNSLLHFQDLCVEHNRLDDFSEAITNTKKDLVAIKSNFNQSIEKSKMIYNKFNEVIGQYNTFLLKLNQDLQEIDDEFLLDVFNQMIMGIKAKLDDLLDFKEIYIENRRMDDLNEVLDVANRDLVKIKDNFAKTINKKLTVLIDDAKLIIENNFARYSEINLKLSDLIDKTNKLNEFTNKQDLLDELDEIRIRLNQELKKLNNIENDLLNVIQNSIDIKLINNEIEKVTVLIDQIDDLNFKKFENILIEKEKTYNALLDLNNSIDSETVGTLLNELNKLFNKSMFMRQLKRYDLNDEELMLVKNEISSDIINHVIGEGEDIKKIIKDRCMEFRKKHAEIEDDEINDLLCNVDVGGIDESVIEECKNKVKQDLLDGNVTINNVELKFNNYLNKKINETAQLDELEKIKSEPNVPSIKIHLTPEETNEIYIVTEKEIISDYGIRGKVEDYVYFLINKKIRENQSEARGRLNTIKRDFSDLTQLNKNQENEFVHQIEYYIYNNEIKYYDISEEYIVKLSNDFINYGKIRLR